MHSSAGKRAPLFRLVKQRVSPSAMSTVICRDFSVCTANTLSKKRARLQFRLRGSLGSAWECCSDGKNAESLRLLIGIYRRGPADLGFDELVNFTQLLHHTCSRQWRASASAGRRPPAGSSEVLQAFLLLKGSTIQPLPFAALASPLRFDTI